MPDPSPPRNESATKRRLLTIARWVGVVVPLAYLADRIDLRGLPASVRLVGVPGFALAFAFQGLSVVVGAMRWRALLGAFGATPAKLPSLGALVRYSFVGLYFALLPTGIVGELVRASRTVDALPRAGDAYYVMVLDRICGAIGLLVLCVISSIDPRLGFESAAVLATIRITTAIVFVGSIGALLLPYVIGRVPGLKALGGRWPKIGTFLALVRPPDSRLALAYAVFLSVITQVLCVLAVAAAIVPVAPDTSLVGVLVPIPAIILLTFMPITPGALGQRELAFVELLGVVGVSATSATAASFVTMVVTIGLALVGGVVVLIERFAATRSPGA